ncbi:ABC transporter ATP-binding protein [Yinghuangia sp. ASG 101]|uniref:ABC transporter ATP-binding protein n=1 Tax=Yinghuangia sp. ASG 101 TaxID=2896848 RepID=UPI001E4FF680|nr:ABC transporter ATP-binding protein [Yinghuangia sp. ASG 101]UGQ13690.1 ABC transporter ATP-binding protein [Yinghuangia sp. ASG 101]
MSFDVRPGEIFGLVGESGSGKSSVCTAVMGLLPSAAHVAADGIDFEGRDLARLRDRDLRRIRGRRIALVPQQPMTSLAPTTPVGRQLRWYLGDRLDDPAVRATLAGIGLGPVLDRPRDLPGAFSGGQLQRLVIAIAALSHEPALLLADEPTTTLDATVQAHVLKLFLTLREELGLGVLYVSHDLAVVARICDRVGVMYGGRLVETAPVREIFTNPRHPYTRALVAAMPSTTPPDEPLRPIPGTADGANLLPGCPFAPRCPHTTDVCTTHMPDTTRHGTTTVACHHPSTPIPTIPTIPAIPATTTIPAPAPAPPSERGVPQPTPKRAADPPTTPEPTPTPTPAAHPAPESPPAPPPGPASSAAAPDPHPPPPHAPGSVSGTVPRGPQPPPAPSPRQTSASAPEHKPEVPPDPHPDAT